METRLGWKNGLILSFLSVVVFLLLLEGGARLFLRVRGKRILTIPCEHYWENKAGMRKVEMGLLYKVNSLGYRGREFPFEKPTGVTRVVCLGDSSTFGFLNSEEECYARLLEECLNSRGGEDKYEVINAGVSGYTTLQEAIALKLRVLPLEPDIVVIQFGHNNRSKIINTDRSFLVEPRGRLAGILEQSRFLHLAGKFFRRFGIVKPERRFVLEESLANIRGDLGVMIELCRKSGAKVIILSWGQHPDVERLTMEGIDLYGKGRYKEAIQKLKRAAGVEYNWDWRPAHYLRLCYEEVGDEEKERRAAELEREFTEEHPWVVDESPYLDACAEVARATGVPFLEYRGEGLKPEFFLDICHPSPVFTRMIADDLCEMVVREMGEKENQVIKIGASGSS